MGIMDECFITIDGDAVVEDFEMEPGLRATLAFFVDKNLRNEPRAVLLRAQRNSGT